MKDNCSTNKKSSCSFLDKGCRTSNDTENLGEYWCEKYTDVDYKTLGWYEKEARPSLTLIAQSNIAKNATIFNVGAGSTTLIDSLLEEGYTSLIANDISSCALNNIKNRIGRQQEKVQFIVDNLIHPTILNQMPKVALWNDRAVLHFFTETKDQDTYFKLLKKKVIHGGFVILSEFNLEGATMCSGLPVKRYNTVMLQEKLGSEFFLLIAFDYDFTMPNGEIRKYIYTLFKRN